MARLRRYSTSRALSRSIEVVPVPRTGQSLIMRSHRRLKMPRKPIVKPAASIPKEINLARTLLKVRLGSLATSSWIFCNHKHGDKSTHTSPLKGPQIRHKSATLSGAARHDFEPGVFALLKPPATIFNHFAVFQRRPARCRPKAIGSSFGYTFCAGRSPTDTISRSSSIASCRNHFLSK